MEHESGGYKPANWQVTGCRALLLIGAVYPEFAEAVRWVTLGREREVGEGRALGCFHLDRARFAPYIEGG